MSIGSTNVKKIFGNARVLDEKDEIITLNQHLLLQLNSLI